MRALKVAVLVICSIWFSGEPALAAKRVALVIGNSAYQHVTRLVNPANDAAAISATLRNAGFEVVQLKRDLKVNEMRRALRDFSDSVRGADVAVVYYAGHGIEIDGTNYLIPVDAVLERDIDAFDEAIPLDRILAVIDPAKQLKLVILDACRDNPFDRTMKRTVASRAIGRGLAKVDPDSSNTLIAFAAKAGSVASEGDGQDSPFTAALVKYLPKPGLDLRKAFGYVRDEVLQVTNNRQEPFIYGSLGGDDIALVPAAVTPAPAPVPVDPNVSVRRDYELATRVGTGPVWDSFIKNHPVGFYTDLAKAQREKLDAEAASEAEDARIAAEKAKALEDAKAAEAERTRIAAQAKAAEIPGSPPTRPGRRRRPRPWKTRGSPPRKPRLSKKPRLPKKSRPRRPGASRQRRRPRPMRTPGLPRTRPRLPATRLPAIRPPVRRLQAPPPTGAPAKSRSDSLRP